MNPHQRPSGPPLITPEKIAQLLRAAEALFVFLPVHFRPLASALLIFVLAAIAILFPTVNTLVQNVEQPQYLATAIMAPDPEDPLRRARDVNLEVYADGRIVEHTVGEAAHTSTPRWKADLPAIPDWTLPAAPSMGWPVDFMRDVAQRRRPLTYCAEERRAWDAQHPGFDTAGLAESAVRLTFDAYLKILPTVENCDDPDLIWGADAQSKTGGCGQERAWGCARLVFQNNRTRVRVTFNGPMLAAKQMPLAAVFWIDVHEGKHAADYNHTGEYGGEGHAHSHLSDLGYICWDRPCDNPSGRPAREDFEDTPGHNSRWEFEFVTGPGPTPTPTASPSPTPTPMPTPVAQAQLWVERRKVSGCELGGDPAWLVVTCSFIVPEPQYWDRWEDRDFQPNRR